MSRVFKAVFIGALIAVGGYFLAPLLFGAGAATPFAGLFGIESALLAAAVGGGILGGLASLLAPSLDLKTVQSRTRVSSDPNEVMKWVFGETALATDLIFAAQHGAKDQFYSYIVAGAAHEIESYGAFYVNDELITFTGDAAIGAWAGVLWRQTQLGTEVQTAFIDIDVDDDFAPGLWPSTADGLGMTHYRLRWKVGEDKISSGVPTRITQVVRGGPVYDPRLDTTRGGTGSHRADNQATWQYNDGADDIGANWALISLRYLLGWKINGKLVIGMGIDPDDIDMVQAMAAANVCEATVDGKPRYRIGGILPVTNDHPFIIDQLEGAINGKIAVIGGKYYIWAPNNDLTPFSSIGEADLIREAGVHFTPSGPMQSLYNTARGSFISNNATDLFNLVPYPEVEESLAVTEDGGLRMLNHDLAMVQDVSVAERVVRGMVRRSRFGATWRFALGPKGLTFQPFSVTTLNIKETNFVNETVRIIDMSFSLSGAVIIEVIEEDSSIYDTTAPLGTPVTQLDPGGFDPNTKIQLTGMLSTDITLRGDDGTADDGFEVTWNDPGLFVQTTEVQYKIAAEAEFIQVPVGRVDLTKAIIWPVQPNTLHDIRARHITRFGVIGDFISLQDTSSDNTTARPTNVGFAANLVYDDLDTTQLAAGQSRYAMLTARATNTSGSQNNFHLTDAILLNKQDFDGTGYSLFYSTIRSGDRITYKISSSRWFTFEVDETFDTVGTGDAEAYKFGVVLLESVDSDPTANISTAAGTAVEFQFNQNPLVEGNLLFDPDFDFSTSLPIVTEETSAGFFDNTSHWVGLKKMTAPSSSPGFGSWGWTFHAGTGPNNSNTIELITALPITSGFTEAWLVARRRIRTNTPSFDVKLRILNKDVGLGDIDLQIQMIGYDLPTSPTAQLVVQKGFKLLYTDGTTYTDLEFHLEAASNVDAQYWEFRIGFNHVVVVDIGECEIDSVFVFPTPRSFGANTFQDEGGGNQKFHAGLVPQSDAVTDATKVLQADGTWVTNAGGAVAFNDLTDVDLTGALDNDMLFRSAGSWIDTAGALTWDGLSLSVVNTDPRIFLEDTNAAVNNKVWQIQNEGEQFRIAATDDARTGSVSAILIDRTLNTVDLIHLLGTEVRTAAKLRVDGSFYLNERATADTAISAFGQFWTRDDAPGQTPMWTGDDDVDHVLNAAGAGDMLLGTVQTITAAKNYADDIELRFGNAVGGDAQLFYEFATNDLIFALANTVGFRFEELGDPKFEYDGGTNQFSMYRSLGNRVFSTRADGIVVTNEATQANSFSLTANDSTDAIILGTNLTDFTIAGFTKLEMDGSLSLLERLTAPVDSGTYGQFWVRDDAPGQTPMFTDDAGVDIALDAGSGGTVTSVGITPGALIDQTGSPITTSGNITVDVDLSELTDMIAAAVGTDEMVLLDAGVQRRKAFNEINLSIFNDNLGHVENATHTGQVTGATTLTLTNSAIPGQTALTTGLVGTDELMVSDAGVIKRMDISVMNAYFNANLSFGGGDGDMLLGTAQTVTGTKTWNNADIQMGDNDEVRFGDLAGGDAHIVWGVGGFTLDSTGDLSLKVSASSENAVQCFANARVALFYNNVEEFRTQDHNSTDNITGAEVQHWDGSFYDVGLARMPRVLFASDTIISDTHWHKRLVHNGTAGATLDLTFNSETSQPQDVVMWAQAKNGPVLLVDGTMTLHLYDGASTPVGGNITIARGGWATIVKDTDTLAHVTGIGLTQA